MSKIESAESDMAFGIGQKILRWKRDIRNSGNGMTTGPEGDCLGAQQQSTSCLMSRVDEAERVTQSYSEDRSSYGASRTTLTRPRVYGGVWTTCWCNIDPRETTLEEAPSGRNTEMIISINELKDHI